MITISLIHKHSLTISSWYFGNTYSFFLQLLIVIVTDPNYYMDIFDTPCQSFQKNRWGFNWKSRADFCGSNNWQKAKFFISFKKVYAKMKKKVLMALLWSNTNFHIELNQMFIMVLSIHILIIVHQFGCPIFQKNS